MEFASGAKGYVEVLDIEKKAFVIAPINLRNRGRFSKSGLNRQGLQ
jgi:hypothetical protein